MKKFSKIFVVLCLISLVVGAFAFSSSANSITDREMLNITKDPNNYYNDFSGKSESLEYFKVKINDSQYIRPVVYQNNRDEGTYRLFKNLSQEAFTGVSGEAIAMLLLSDYENTALKCTNGNVDGYDYVVVDFDFAASRYSYLDGSKIYHTAEEVPEEFEESKDLAFPDCMSLSLGLVGIADLSKTPASYPKWHYGTRVDLFIRKNNDDGKWYIYQNDWTAATWYSKEPGVGYSTKGSEDNFKKKIANGQAIELSGEVNVFDHVTFVLDVKNEKVVVLINGNYLSEFSYSAFDFQLVMLTSIQFAIPNAEKAPDKYSFSVDNAASNWYKDYKGTDNGLGAYMSSGAYKTQSLKYCDDVLYNEDYVSPGSPVIADVYHLDSLDTSIECYTQRSTMANMRDGDFVKIYSSFENFTPPQGVNEMTFIAEKDSVVTLSAEAKELYMIQHTGNRYTVRLATEKAMSVKWFDSTGDDRAVIKEQKLLPWTESSNTIRMYGKVDRTNPRTPKIQIFNKWIWDVNCNGVQDAEDKEAGEILDKIFSVAEISELREQGINEINMIPIYDTRPLVYSVETMDSQGGEKPDFYAPDFDYGKFTDISTLKTTLAAVKDGVEVKVILYTDISLTAEDSYVIPTGTVINFDLNGFKVSQAVGENSMIFDLQEASALKIYSSVKGAQLYQHGTDMKGAAIVSSSSDNFDTASLTITEQLTEQDSVGDYLTAYGASIVYFKGSKTDVFNNKRINVTLDGGKYCGVTAANGALLPISKAEITYNVLNALLITVNGDPIFSEIKDCVVSAEINVISSSVIVGSLEGTRFTVGSFIGNWSSASKAYLKDSVISGLEYRSNLSFGSGNKLNYKGNYNDTFFIEKGVNVAFSNENSASETINFKVPGNTNNLTANFEITVITFADGYDYSKDSIKEITWLNPNGEKYAATYWVAGSTITVMPSVKDFGSLALNNGWFDAEYSGWVTNDTSKKDFTVSANGTNTFKPVAENFYSDLKVVQVSLQVTSGLSYNVYIPNPSISGYTVTFLGFYSGNTSLSYSQNATIDGKGAYNKYVGKIANDKFVADSIVVRFKVNDTILESTITVDVFNYANKVHETYGCGSDESNLVYSIMKYKEANGNYNSFDKISLKSYFATHGVGCGCKEVTDTNKETPAIDIYNSGKDD